MGLVEPPLPRGGRGVTRSLPLHASRVALDGEADVLGYVVALRVGENAQRLPPDGAVWRPDGEQCELGVEVPGQELQWIACERIDEVSRPNGMAWAERFRLAFSRVIAATDLR